MSKEQQAALLKLASENDITAEAYDDYSGRGMFGETTHAIEYEEREDIGELVGLYRAKTGERLSLRTDSMGKGYIAY